MEIEGHALRLRPKKSTLPTIQIGFAFVAIPRLREVYGNLRSAPRRSPDAAALRTCSNHSISNHSISMSCANAVNQIGRAPNPYGGCKPCSYEVPVQFDGRTEL